jgi:hypothetical protein
MRWGKIFCIFFPCFFGIGVLAQEGSSLQKKESDSGGVHIEFDPVEDSSVSNEMRYTPPIQTIASNPVIAMTLASGADAINRSVDSLMDSLFYSLLDNERIFSINNDVWFQLGLNREVYSTSFGSFVVFDRFRVGPNYLKELARFHDVPIKLGVDANTEILQIYLRSDGLRVHELEKLSFWRQAANQWFGFLPFLAAILPPSFNQNELYDPLKQAYTPFSFPFDVRGFYEMPIGSIRSYAISGGARLFAELGERIPSEGKKFLERVGQFRAPLPYSVFVRGEHRINVLRRGENIAWVGIKNIRRTGHAITSLIGDRFDLFRGSISAKILRWNWIWQGRPVNILPIDLNLEQAFGAFFDQVYEFDLTKVPAQEAYKAAVKGDFVPSRLRYLEAKEQKKPTGVDFHFARNQSRRDLVFDNGPNVALLRSRRSSGLGKADVEVTDKEGKFYILEASHDVSDQSWNVLVGEKERRFQQSVELRVKKVIQQLKVDESDTLKENHFYVFDSGPDPYRLTVVLNIQDRNVVGSDLADYIKILKDVSGLALEQLPSVKVRDPIAESEYRRTRFFSGPDLIPFSLHVTPAFLGRFGAQLLMSFSGKDLERILERSEDEVLAAFAEANNLDKGLWTEKVRNNSFFDSLWLISSYVMAPLRLINMRWEKIDAMKEGMNLVHSLRILKKKGSPEDMLEGFGRLIDTSYPGSLLKSLLLLADSNKVSRRVVFSTESKGRGSEEEKQLFSKMNNMVFKGGIPIPAPSRYSRSKEKLAGFYLDRPQGGENRPQILRIDVVSREVPTSLQFLQGGTVGWSQWDPQDAGTQDRHVLMNVVVKGAPTVGPIKLFIKIEQAGRLKVGKLELAERVVEVPRLSMTNEPADRGSYELYLTGPLSPLKGFLLDRAVRQGDQFLVSVSCSIDGVQWGDSRSFEFIYENGKLMSPS